MLVLSRKRDQSIRIGSEIRVTILEIRGEQVSVGIEAPKSVDIYREEVFKEVLSENVEAAQSGKNIDPSDDIPIDRYISKK